MERTPFIRPKRDLAWFRHESTAAGLAASGLGTASLIVVVAGTITVLVAGGLTPVARLVMGITSDGLTVVALTALAVGLAAAAIGGATYRRAPTKLGREEAIAGAVLGLQGAAASVAVLAFQQADVERIARNFLNIERVTPHIGAFVRGAKNTIVLAASGELIGVVLGLVLALFLVSKRAVVRAPARAYVNFFRGTPLLWQLTIGHFGIVSAFDIVVSPFTTGIIVFGLNTAAYSAEVFRAGIQSIERSQLEAARGLGMSYLQAMRYAVVPQAVRRVIPPLTNEFVILIKDTSLIIFLGLSVSQYELMSVGQSGYSNSFNATFFVATALGYLAITLPMIRIVNVVERRLRSGLVGVAGA